MNVLDEAMFKVSHMPQIGTVTLRQHWLHVELLLPTSTVILYDSKRHAEEKGGGK